MAEEQARIERLEKASQESQERHVKTSEDISQMMEMLKMITRNKQSTEAPIPQTEVTPMRNTAEDPSCPQAFAFPHENQATYASASQTFPFNYGLPQVINTPGMAIRENRMDCGPIDPLAVPDLDEIAEKEKLAEKEKSFEKEKYELLEERMRAVEGINIPGSIDAAELSLVPGLIIPPKFKTPIFDKYDGTKCPSTHLTMYCRRMSAYTDNDKLLIHCFQDSLIGTAAQWYMKLDKVHIKSWKDLARAFLKQHQSATDFIPDRLVLQAMEKRYSESFRDYAQRWRMVATQVQPPLIETETAILFLGTLQEPYYDRLMHAATGSFANMVKAGNLVDHAIKSGKIDLGESSSKPRKSFPKKKEGETQAVYQQNPPNQSRGYASYPRPYYSAPINQAPTMTPQYTSPNQTQAIQTRAPAFNNQPNPPRTNYPTNNQINDPQPVRPGRLPVEPIPVLYADLLPRLIQGQLIARVPLTPKQPPYPRWYDANATCDYHYGAKGHSTENCLSLKNQVQALRDAGLVSFGYNKDGVPNVISNPLPNHSGPRINAVSGNFTDGRRTCVCDVIMPMAVIHEKLTQAGFLQLRGKEVIKGEELNQDYCQFHSEIRGHAIQECKEFQQIVQGLMDMKEIEFSGLEDSSIRVITGTTYAGTPSSMGPRPMTIFHDNEMAATEVPKIPTPVLLVEVPKTFSYTSQKAVPWNYDCSYTYQTDVNDLTGIGGFTRSGRCYAPGLAEEIIPESSSAPVNEEQSLRENERLSKEKKGKDKEIPESSNKPIVEKEASEFLKFIKHSEYSVIEQLNKTPAKISLLSLLQSSETHRNALSKALGEIYVTPNLSVDGVDQLIGNVTAGACIAFTDEEIPPEGRDSAKALHITVKCKSHILPRALLDNGSSLNVMPMSTLVRLPIDLSNLRKSQMVVRAFDGTKREVLGNIQLPIQVGPSTFDSEFIVMDINPSYNCLLGRPWIHMAGAVPSTLHQKVKFVVEKSLITVVAEEDMIAATTTNAPYLEVQEDATECSFRSFEIATATKEEPETLMSRLSPNTQMILKQTIGKGAKAGCGLGRDLQGEHVLISLPILKRNHYGIGYQPYDQGRYGRIQKENRTTRPYLTFPPLSWTFRSGGFINITPSGREKSTNMPFQALTIGVITEEAESSHPAVYPYPSDSELNNWSAVEIPIAYKLSK